MNSRSVREIIESAAKPWRGPRRAEKRSVVCVECDLYRQVGRFGAPSGKDELPSGAIHHAGSHQTFADIVAYRRVSDPTTDEIKNPTASGLVLNQAGYWSTP